VNTDSVYVLDTHILVWFLKGFAFSKITPRIFLRLVNARSRIVIPLYCLEEIRMKFPYLSKRSNDISVPPTSLLRLLRCCGNVRVLPRNEALFARELQLERMRQIRQVDLDSQDIPIAAAALVVRDTIVGPMTLVTSESKLRRWALRQQLEVCG
jgi:hypothetical protein